MTAVSTIPEIVTAASPTVLFVDLDNTLIKTDLLHESLIKAAKQCPLKLLAALPTLSHGRAAFKNAIAEITTPDCESIPYRPEVIELLEEQVKMGASLVLATASPRRWADAVAGHLGVFDDVIATEQDRNLKGDEKLNAIHDYAVQHGYESWGYVGDSKADIPIFAAAGHSYLVTGSPSLEVSVRRMAAGKVTVIPQPRFMWRAVVKAMRPHQWAKNILVCVPMVLAHAFTWSQGLSALLAWICFSCVASSVYVLNDLLDVESDRRHPRKCRRPFAAATLPVTAGLFLMAGLLTIGGTLAVFALPAKFVLLLAAYWVLTTLYSVWIKSKLILDVMALAGLYTLRVIAGGAAVDVPVSEWLMAFSMFFFTSLAFAKRYAELSRLALESQQKHGDDSLHSTPDSAFAESTDKNDRPHGRSYRVEDIGMIESLGPTSGYLSVLVLALYINGPQVAALYRNGWALWYICPALLYWITRLWFVAKRHKLSEDPVIFALRDRTSLLTGLVVSILMAIAILL